LAESYLGLVRGGWLMVKRGRHMRPFDIQGEARLYKSPPSGT
jgi:hypothetical protein